MERSSKLKSKILEYLVSKRSENTNSFKSYVGKRFSGPLIPTKDECFGAHVPTSPKVSCIGQIKSKNKIKHEHMPLNKLDQVKNTKKSSSIKKPNSAKPERTWACDDATYDDLKRRLPDRAPSLSQMKMFASGREPLVNFDWQAQLALMDADYCNYYSDEEMKASDHDEVVTIPFSAPKAISGGCGVALQPRKEVNLWKRRTIAPPTPLQVHRPWVGAH